MSIAYVLRDSRSLCFSLLLRAAERIKPAKGFSSWSTELRKIVAAATLLATISGSELWCSAQSGTVNNLHEETGGDIECHEMPHRKRTPGLVKDQRVKTNRDGQLGNVSGLINNSV